MTSRRLIRIKVLQLFYAYTKTECTTIEKVEKDLLRSISKTTDLYYETLLLLVEIRNKAAQKIDIARNRRFPSNQDLNPNTRFIENPIFSIIDTNNKYQNHINTNFISWADNSETVLYFYNKLMNSPSYHKYMKKEDISFADHKEFILYLFTELIAQDELFFQTIEDKNIFWNDDIEIVFNNIYKTIYRLKESMISEETKEQDIFPKIYNTQEDAQFARSLITKVCFNNENNMNIIEKHIHNWELDRISEIDKIIMSCAITELRNFPSIPIKVTLDEYIDIAKNYSSIKSGAFINGVLDKVVEDLKENNQIIKTGRGLIDSSEKIQQ